MKSNWLLCLAAGIVGGAISHFAWSIPVHAQNSSSVTRTGSPSPPQVYTATPEIHAQEFILLDSKGVQKASIQVDSVHGLDLVEILNSSGQVIFTAGGSGARLLSAP